MGFPLMGAVIASQTAMRVATITNLNNKQRRGKKNDSADSERKFENQEKYYNFNCPKCMCLIGAKHSELTWESDHHNGEYCKLKCPECGVKITGGNGNSVDNL